MAQSFLTWARKGWAEKTHYVFLITDLDGEIVAAVDIKSNTLENAEIGYWASSTSPGLVSHAVAMICLIGREAGYTSFIGLTLPDNEKSASVLRRNLFSDLGIVEDRGKRYRKFRKEL